LSPTFQKIEPVSKKNRVAASLKEAILSGALKSGEAIVEGKVAQQFGVGQGLIREALIELEHEGFVQRTPFSGTQVVKVSSEDAQQVFEIRIALEPLAVSLAGRALTPEGIVELERLANKASRSAEKKDLESFFENHLAFRRRIWELSGNRYLQQALERAIVPLYALYIIRRPNRSEGVFKTVEDCIDHQQEILAAYKAGDWAKAQEVTYAFLVRMKEYLRTVLPPASKLE
jgi:DNA-binding GntR family transcriptional regulator